MKIKATLNEGVMYATRHLPGKPDQRLCNLVGVASMGVHEFVDKDGSARLHAQLIGASWSHETPGRTLLTFESCCPTRLVVCDAGETAEMGVIPQSSAVDDLLWESTATTPTAAESAESEAGNG